MLKRERKAMRKRFLSPNFDKENHSITGMSEAKEENIHSQRGDISQFATPIKEELGRVSILDKMLYKNHFDSYDSRSPISMSVFEEKDYHGITPVRRFLGASHKISPEESELEIGGDIKFGPNEISPYHDRFKSIWRSCIENDDKKSSFGLNQHPKGFGKVITKRTP